MPVIIPASPARHACRRTGLPLSPCIRPVDLKLLGSYDPLPLAQQ
jgi:hypothetical protein